MRAPINEDPSTTTAIAQELTITTGYRRDDFDWNIAAPGGTPNILSELTWSDLDTWTISGQLDLPIKDRWRSRVKLDLGTTLNGDNQDSDYLGNHRTLEFSRSNNNVEKGTLIDFSVGIGHTSTLLATDRATFSLTPWLGYSTHLQNLRMNDGRQTVSEPPMSLPLGPFDGLDSSYDAFWHGPWVGLQGDLALDDRHTLSGQIEYHWADYDAEAEWNLRTDLAQPVSFEHDADGHGINALLSWRYRAPKGPTWQLSLGHQDWQAGPGDVTVHTAGGDRLNTRLNEVNWRSTKIDLGVNYAF